MPTPQYGLPSLPAGESGRYPAVDGSARYVTAPELAILLGELKAQLADLAARHAALARDVGRLEGMLSPPAGR